jgi:hypothetical protein
MIMRYLIFILSLCLLVGCTISNSDQYTECGIFARCHANYTGKYTGGECITCIKNLQQNVSNRTIDENTQQYVIAEHVIDCKHETKILQKCPLLKTECYFAMCYRCINTTISIMPGILAPGDWVCPI